MGRKKDPNKKTRVEEIRDNLTRSDLEHKESARKPQEEDSGVDNRESFRAFWAAARKEYGKPRDLEEILWAHLKSAGFDRPEAFEQGLEHFGLKR
jgi:hypothetical protein